MADYSFARERRAVADERDTEGRQGQTRARALMNNAAG